MREPDGTARRRDRMRPNGGGLAVFAIVVAIAAAACASAPARQLRVIEGGIAADPTHVPTPVPTQSTMPEPPVGVIFLGRLVLPCGQGPHCEAFARVVPVARMGVAYGSGRGYRPAPATDPVPLAGVVPADALGMGRAGRAEARNERDRGTRLEAGQWRVEVFAPSPVAPSIAAETRADAGAVCSALFEVRGGEAVRIDIVFSGQEHCRIGVAPGLMPR